MTADHQTAGQTELEGQVALVTGASTGLGAHFACLLASAGATVLLASRRQDALSQVCGQIMASGGKCDAIVMDVSCSTSIAAVSDAFKSVDILVNNAGIVREAAALDQSEDDWDAVIDTNLKGTFLVSQAVGRAMRERGRGGAIINIASIVGIRQAGGVLPYAVSKAGVIQLTKVMALELARYGIRVNAIAPGYFATELNVGFWDQEVGSALKRRIPQRRLGELHELDGALLLLAGSQSTYMTGSVIEVDGGHLTASL